MSTLHQVRLVSKSPCCGTWVDGAATIPITTDAATEAQSTLEGLLLAINWPRSDICHVFSLLIGWK